MRNERDRSVRLWLRRSDSGVGCKTEPREEVCDHKRQGNQLFWEKVVKTDSCWIWNGPKDGFGYGMISTNRVCKRAHIRSWEIHRGQVPKGTKVLHNCPGGDNPACINPEHLWLGSLADNNRDRARKGRSAKGERCGSAKLTRSDVWAIKAFASSGRISLRAIGRRFGVCHDTVKAILRGETWR